MNTFRIIKQRKARTSNRSVLVATNPKLQKRLNLAICTSPHDVAAMDNGTGKISVITERLQMIVEHLKSREWIAES